MSPQVHVLPTPADVASELATRTADALRAALATEPRASLCLTGGSTPAPAYRQLATLDAIAWDRVHVFWGDERAVGPDHADSNYRLACETLLNALDLPEANLHRIEGERGAEAAAYHYEQVLLSFFGAESVTFDVLHLGMGGDGHTASLFPGSPALAEMKRYTVDTVAPPASPIRDRVSLTFPVLNSARTTLIAAHGEGKREAFAAALDAFDDPETPPSPPVAKIRPESGLTWLIDRELASGLNGDPEPVV
ncbi:MAG: 6-phosphogluconolactonase [Bacteroidota bacterium]